MPATGNETVSSYHPYAAGRQGRLAEALLDGGAALHGLQDDNMPLSTALAFGFVTTAQVLVQRGARVDNLVAAAGLGDVDLVRRFLDDELRSRRLQRFVDPMGPRIEDPQRLRERAVQIAKICKQEVVVRMLTEGH